MGGIWTDVRVMYLTVLVLGKLCSHVEMCMLILNNLKVGRLRQYLVVFLSPASQQSGILININP